MAAKLRVGILGAGEAGTGHANAFARLPDVEIVALWSRTRQRAQKLAAHLRLPRVRLYADWRGLIEDRSIDIVSLATPESMRRETFLMALDCGHHVLVEDSISDNLSDATLMAQAAKRAKTVTAMCFNWRYTPGTQTVWREIQKGKIGPVRDVRTEYRYRRLSNRYYTDKGFKADAQISGESGVAGIEFDKVRLLSGCEIKRVVSRIVAYSPPKAPNFTLLDGSSIHMLELSNGSLATVRVTATAGEYEWSMTVCGEKGTLRCDLESATRQTVAERESVLIKIPKRSQRPKDFELDVYVWYCLFQDFVTAIRREDVTHATVACLPSIEDGQRVLRAVMAARRSAQEVRWVDLNELPG
jgi:predicted dehydrogenase